METEDFFKFGESLEDLEYKNLYILQNKNGYHFTSDSVLLAGLSPAHKGDKVVDLGCGSGVIALLVAARVGAEVWGVELQKNLANMAQRSVEYNGMAQQVHVVQCDMREAPKLLGCGAFDLVVCNPPYRKASEKLEYTEQDICKTEVAITLKEVIQTAARLLKYGGKLSLICKAERLADIFCFCREANLEPKKVVPIQPKPMAAIDTVVVLATLGAKPPLIFCAPFVVYTSDGAMSEQTRRLYHK